MPMLTQESWIVQAKAANNARVVFDLNFNKRWQQSPVGADGALSAANSLNLQHYPFSSDPGVANLVSTNSPVWGHNNFDGNVNDSLVFVKASNQHLVVSNTAQTAALFDLFTGKKAFTIFVVYRCDNNDGSVNSHEQVHFCLARSASPGAALDLYFDTGGFSVTTRTTSWGLAGGSAALPTYEIVTGVGNVDCLTTDGTSPNSYHNGTSTGSSITYTALAAQALFVGRYYTSTSGQFAMDGRIARILIFDKKLDDASRNLITRKLGKKYGITVA